MIHRLVVVTLQVYLPHGAYVKVSTSGQLINVWIVPSPTDLYMTEGVAYSFYQYSHTSLTEYRLSG